MTKLNNSKCFIFKYKTNNDPIFKKQNSNKINYNINKNNNYEFILIIFTHILGLLIHVTIYIYNLNYVFLHYNL